MTKRIWIKSGVAITLYGIFQFGNFGLFDLMLFWLWIPLFLFHYYSCKRVEKHNEAIRHCSYALANCANSLLVLSGMFSIDTRMNGEFMFFGLIDDPPYELFNLSRYLLHTVIVLDLMLWILPITGLCRGRRRL